MDNQPNVEKLVIQWLNGLAEVTEAWPVSGDIPKTRPESFITVDRTGGPREAMVLDAAVVLIEVYHKTSRSTASDMANYIADQAPSLPAFAENITGANVNSVVNLDDIIGEYSRYQVYLDVYNRR
jgi:hypothetical protein